MAVHIHALSPGPTLEAMAMELDLKGAKEHPPRGHLVDQRVQPVDEQQVVVACSPFLPSCSLWRLSGTIIAGFPAPWQFRSVRAPLSFGLARIPRLTVIFLLQFLYRAAASRLNADKSARQTVCFG